MHDLHAQLFEYRVNALREIRPALRSLARELTEATPQQMDGVLCDHLRDLPSCELLYVLDREGRQVSSNVRRRAFGFGIALDRGEKNVSRAHCHYYRDAVTALECVITEPYRSKATGHPVVTVTYPVSDAAGRLVMVIAADIRARDLLYLVTCGSRPAAFLKLGRGMYLTIALFLGVISTALLGHALVELWGLVTHLGREFDPDRLFQATIMATLSLAVFDLGRTVFEEEVLFIRDPHKPAAIRKALSRFMGSIIIALAIEALLLVFKSTIKDPSLFPNAVALIAAVGFLLLTLGAYVYLGSRAEAAAPARPGREHEPPAGGPRGTGDSAGSATAFAGKRLGP
ncbi:MAG: hypothetical protein HZA24_06575 [Nitrospirae bacterium]|nr:hypothetical protein [Nitrospirota bacterium]